MTPSTIATVALVVSLINVVAGVLMGIYHFIDRKSRITGGDIKKVEARVSNHGERIRGIEEKVNAAPSHKDLADLHEKVNGVASDVGTIKGQVGGMTSQVQMIHQHLLGEKDKS